MVNLIASQKPNDYHYKNNSKQKPPKFGTDKNSIKQPWECKPKEPKQFFQQ